MAGEPSYKKSISGYRSIGLTICVRPTVDLTGIVSVEDVEVFKPHPKAYQNIENHTDRSLEECTMVATHTFDIAGAQAVGMKTILVNRFNIPPTRLSHTSDMVVDSYAELATELS